MLSVESGASCGASFPVDRETVRSPSFFLSRFSRGMAVSPTARASHGNVMQITTGTRWARTGNVSASRRARAAEAAPGRAARVEPVTLRNGFQDYYAVKSHLSAARRLVAGYESFARRACCDRRRSPRPSPPRARGNRSRGRPRRCRGSRGRGSSSPSPRRR